MRAVKWIVALLASGIVLSAAAAARGPTEESPVKIIEAEKCWLPEKGGLKPADDPAASGSKVAAVPEGAEGQLLICTALQHPKPGRYHGALRFKVERLDEVGRCFSVRAYELPDLEGARHQMLSVKNGYGWRFPGYGGGFVELPFEFEVSGFPKSVDVNVFRNDTMAWSDHHTASGDAPAGALDCIKIYTQPDRLPAIHITGVWPDKICYRPDENAMVTMTLQNTTEQLQKAIVQCQLESELTDIQALGSRKVTLGPRERIEVQLPWKTGKQLYGIGLRAQVLVDSRLVDSVVEYCQVHEDPQRVAVEGADRGDYAYRHPTAQFLVQAPLTSRQVARMAIMMRKAYCNKAEAYCLKAPGGGFNQFSGEGAWMSYGGGWHRGFRRTALACGRELARQGILWTPYFDGYAWSKSLEDWMLRRPEWFLYEPSTGEVLGSYDTRMLFWHRQAGQFGLDVSPIGCFAGVPNYAREDTVDYAADQVIEARKVFKIPGLRWDFHVTVWPGYADFGGRVVARDYEQADAISAKMLKRFKDRINRAIPNFYWGYNAGSIEDVRNYPLTNAVRDEGGGYMLDECIYAAFQKNSPYHGWEPYLKYNADMQEWHHQRGGYFNPYAPHRQGSERPVDRIYDTILRACTGSHPSAIFYDSSLRMGNYAQFATRYSAFLFAEDRSRLHNAEQLIDVSSERRVWWKPVVYERRPSTGKRQLIVNLINPPMNRGIDEPPFNKLPPPARDVRVALKEPPGWRAAAAWLLMFESENENAEPETQHKALAPSRQGHAISVIVPCVFHWKMVVFDLEKAGGAG